MAYQDWEKYHNKKSASGVKKTASKSQSTKSKKSTSSTAKKATTTKKRTVKRKVANRKKKYKHTPKNTLIMLLIGTSLTGILYTAAKDINIQVGAESVKPMDSTSIQDKFNEFFNPIIIDEEHEYSQEESLLAYEDYCYVGKYGDKSYLFCPEEYILEIAEHSIDKLNEQYKSSGEMSLLENGECIPDIITPELLAAICFTESSYRVESATGLPLGADRNVSASDRAEGILQQKPAFVSDADRYSRMYGGEGYTLEDRYNPLTAMEMCVTNLTRIYREYLRSGCQTYKNLVANGADEDTILGALIVAYNQGEGSMQSWAKSGKLVSALENYHNTDKYGADYYRMVMDNLEDILEEDYSK